MICKYCNKEVTSVSNHCSYCGALLNDNLTTNNIPSGNNHNLVPKANIFLAILSFFIPIVGVIIFIIKKDSDPKTAKASGICALVSFVLNFVCIILYSVLFLVYAVFSVESAIEKFPDTEYSDEVIIPTDWTEYKFMIKDQSLTLPIYYSELSDMTGFSLNSIDSTMFIDAGKYYLFDLYLNDKVALSIELFNHTDVSLLATDCIVTKISQNDFHVFQDAPVITFADNIKVGSSLTTQKVKKIFGDPDMYYTEGIDTIFYTYYEDKNITNSNFFVIKVVNGVVEEVSLDNKKIN